MSERIDEHDEEPRRKRRKVKPDCWPFRRSDLAELKSLSERIEPDRPYDPFDGLWRDEEPDYPTTPDDARKHLQDFADARRDKYLSVKRMVAMGKRLLGDATFSNDADWVPYLILIRRWCETSEQEA